MPPGILRLRTACCTLVIPIRLAICLPLLICTLDAYSPHSALLPQGMLPLFINNTRVDHPDDAHRAPGYISRPPISPSNSTHVGRVLTLSFVLAASALSMLSMIALWWLGNPAAGEEDDATLVEGERARRLYLGTLVLGTATRLSLGGLGTVAMVCVINERSTIKHGSFIAVEVLGWLLVGMLYCGAFHRIYSLLRTSGVLQRGRRKCVLPGYVIGKHEHDRTLGDTFSKI